MSQDGSKATDPPNAMTDSTRCLPNLTAGLKLLEQVIAGRLRAASFEDMRALADGSAYYDDGSPFAEFIATFQPSFEEYFLVLLALAAHVRPTLLNDLVAQHMPQGGDFPAFGGVRDGTCRSVLPTGETAQFLLAGDDLANRLLVQQMLGGDHWFARRHVLWLGSVGEGVPAMSGRLILAPEVVEQLTVGTIGKPRFSAEFPAEWLDTRMQWEDLVLNPETRRQIEDIEQWMFHKDTLLHDWGMICRMKPGYRALFHGPPGTGKTLTATLLGRQTRQDVFRVDLSRVISKYIGETEKSLSRLFDRAEHKRWILFFDEADALFAKRTDVRDAHDKYANQEAAYLLQRIESYDGLVILVTNQRGNIDDAFVRRFQSIIHFAMPDAGERERLWRQTMPPQIELAPDLRLASIATEHQLTGASILNICHYCALQVLASGRGQLDRAALEAGIYREYVKEGRVV